MRNLHGMTIGDLRLLCTVAEAGSISAAATTLGYTQSGVSRRVAAMERATGTDLMTRLPRGVRLTHAGERLRSYAMQILQTVGRAEHELERAEGMRRLRIGTFSTANSTVMPRVISRLGATNPELNVTVREGRSAALLRALDAGSIELAVVSDYPALPPTPAGAALDHLVDDPVVVAIPARHALAGGHFALRHLASTQWIEGDRSESQVLLAAAANAGFEPNIGYRVRDWNTKLAYVAAGLGASLVPGLAAASRPPDVVFHRLPDELPERTIFVASIDGVAHDPPLAALRRAVQQVTHEVMRDVPAS